MNARIPSAAAAILAALLASALAGSAAESPHGATVSPMRAPPKIDGTISAGEWDTAVRTCGFQAIGWAAGHVMDARAGTTRLGFTHQRLYLAVVSELPPTGPFIRSRNRDAEVIFDSSIEVLIDPNRDTRATGRGDLGFYKFMGNPAGNFMDCRFDTGAPDTGWNGNWEYANHVDPATKLWTAELSIPFADLGWKEGARIGRSIGVLVARNFKAPWNQVTWFPHDGAFVSWFEYPRIRLTRDAPSVQVESLGEKFFTGRMQLRVRVVNPGPARDARVRLHVTSSDMPELKDEAALKLAAGAAASYAFDVPDGRLHGNAKHKMLLVVTSADGKEQYLHYALQWTKAPARKWHVRTGPNPQAAVQLAHYPSFGLVRIRVDTGELGKAAAAIRSAKLALTAPGGKAVWTGAMAWEQVPAVKEFRVGDLADGAYTATVSLDGWKEPFVRTFRRKHFAWEHNRLGITDKVLSPFLPVEADGSDVAIVGRRYACGGLGLWRSVRTEGKELLAGPIVLKADGHRVLTGKGGFTRRAATEAVYEATAADEAVTVKTRCTTEVDGCMKVEMELLPAAAGKVLGSLAMEVPLKDAAAPLFHVSSSTLRTNPAGAAPTGAGDVWDSRRYPDGEWFGNFKCFIYLGGPARGLCWFADNDAGWVLDAAKDRQAPCLVLNRSGQVLTLRVNLVQKPVTLTAARKIVFGLMATPAKPMPADWRSVGFDHDHPNCTSVIRWMGSEYWGSDTDCSAKYPRHGDLGILDRMRDARLGVTFDRKGFVADWRKRHFQPGMPTVKGADQMVSLANVSLNMAAGARPPRNRFVCYWEEFHSTNHLHEEVVTFGSEWSGQYGFGSTGGIVASYRDFAVWWGAQFIRRGIGLYFDNAFPKRAYDPLTTSAYVLPNGQVQPSAGLWAHREYLRRTWVIHRTQADPRLPVIQMIHMTNTNIPPYLVWNDSNLDLEWFYGPKPAQSKYPHDMLRAQSLGLKSGNIPLALARTTGGPKDLPAAERLVAERTRFGAMMVHEIKVRISRESAPLLKKLLDFGYGLDDCRVYNYWADDFPLAASDDEAKTLLLKRGGKLLLLICTWNPGPAKVTFTLDAAAIGVSPSRAVDDESQQVLALDGGSLTVGLKGYDVRLVRLEQRPP